MQRATQFVDEIRSSLEFYTAQTQGARIERLLVSGGGSKLEGFIDILRAADPRHGGARPGLQPRGFAARPLRGGSGRSRAGARDRGRPRDPVGRWLVSQVNLLPPEIQAAQRQRRLAGVVALAGIGVIGLILVFYVLQLGKVSAIRSDIEEQKQTNAESAEPDPGAPGVRRAPRARPGQAGAPERGVRQRDLVLRPADGHLSRDPELRRAHLDDRDGAGAGTDAGRLHAAHRAGSTSRGWPWTTRPSPRGSRGSSGCGAGSTRGSRRSRIRRTGRSRTRRGSISPTAALTVRGRQAGGVADAG